MTPAARVAAAIEVLDQVNDGTPAEKALINWARGSRFAGSKDRAAVRDHVFGVLRQKRSCAGRGGGVTGRALMLGLLTSQGADLAALFDGKGYGPSALTAAEREDLASPRNLGEADELDAQDWVLSVLKGKYPNDFNPILTKLQQRAPVHLRVNLTRASRTDAIAALREDDIQVSEHSLAKSALTVESNPRRVKQSRAFLSGLVELQDAASQAVVDLLPLQGSPRALDYCAGGGGKALAMADLGDGSVFAHDAVVERMKDIPVRAQRAGVSVHCLTTEDLPQHSPFDLVFCDAPCSGSGAWRRSPEAKWRLTPDHLQEFVDVQAKILDDAAPLVAVEGTLAYATCSLFPSENSVQIQAFIQRHPEWSLQTERQFTPLDGGDGFYVAVLTRSH